MDKLFEKGISLGLGFFTMTREKGEQIVDKLIEKGEISRKEASGVLDEILNRAEKEKEELEKRINSSLERTLKKFNVPTKEEIDELNQKLDNISQKLEKMETTDKD
ncbi:MAG: phasin family protein [Candidatus Marinimicrobia bacterium]|nr:phasin family protein [Candidatus Neomarinimicrobiota bacterium]